MPDLYFLGIGLAFLLSGGACAFIPTQMFQFFRQDDSGEEPKKPDATKMERLGVRLFGIVLIACGITLVYVSVFGTNAQNADDIPGL